MTQAKFIEQCLKSARRQTVTDIGSSGLLMLLKYHGDRTYTLTQVYPEKKTLATGRAAVIRSALSEILPQGTSKKGVLIPNYKNNP